MATISTHTQSLSLCGHPSIELHNTSTRKSAAAFRRDRLKLSLSGCHFCNTLFHGKNWSFQQDTQAMETQQWQETNVMDFSCTSDWPSASPDLNPFDYKLWSNLQEMACKRRLPKIDSLKQSLQKATVDFPIHVLCNSIDGCPQRPKYSVCAPMVATW